MPKKKLLAGKKTKLANLALTRALENNSAATFDSPGLSEVGNPSLSQVVRALREWQGSFDQPTISIQDKSVPSPSALQHEYSYFYLLEELRDLQQLLNPGGRPTASRRTAKGNLIIPSPKIFQELVRLTVMTLREIKSLLD